MFYATAIAGKTPVIVVTDEARSNTASLHYLEDGMPETSLAFAILDTNPGTNNCSICAKNPATLKATGTHNGACCLQCAFSMLADLAHSSIEHSIKRMG